MHKNPIGSRFIAASSVCTTNPLLQLLRSSLKLITKHFNNIVKGSHKTWESTAFGLSIMLEVLKKVEKMSIQPKGVRYFIAMIFLPSTPTIAN